MNNYYLDSRECTPKCRSSQHASDLNALLTKTSDVNLLLSGIQQCWNCHKVHDTSRRYLMHMAAACGHTEVAEWLLQFKKAELTVRTLENNWTPAHCAAFYGNIGTLVALVKRGANLSSIDDDKLTCIEHLAIDKWSSIRNKLSVYSKKKFLKFS